MKGMVSRKFGEKLPFAASGFGLSWDGTLEFESARRRSHDGDRSPVWKMESPEYFLEERPTVHFGFDRGHLDSS